MLAAWGQPGGQHAFCAVKIINNRAMMKQTTKRRSFLPRPSPIRVTPFRGAADRRYVTVPWGDYTTPPAGLQGKPWQPGAGGL